MEPVVLDERDDGVVVARWPRVVKDEATQQFFDDVQALLSRGRPMALVLDATRVGPVSATVRRIAGKRLAQQRAQRHLHLAAEATVIRNVLIRGVLTAIYWLAPPGYPNKVFSDLSEAEAWASAQLGALRERQPRTGESAGG